MVSPSRSGLSALSLERSHPARPLSSRPPDVKSPPTSKACATSRAPTYRHVLPANLIVEDITFRYGAGLGRLAGLARG